MTIIISLSPEIEAQLREKAARQGQDINLVAAELLSNALAWELQDSEAAIEGIQHGLDAFDVGQSRSFQAFAEEQRKKYNLSADA
jgi:hypothetical protein